MKAIKITAATVLICLILGAALSAYTWFNREARDYDEHTTFDGNKVTAVQVRAFSTDVNLLKSNDDNVHVDFTGQVLRGGIGGREYELNTDLQGETLSIELRHKSHFQLGILEERNLRLEVRVPEKLYNELSVTTASGDVQATGQQAETMTIKTSSGDIRGRDLQGKRLQVSSTSGEQDLQNMIGEVHLESTSGDITLRKWTGERIEVQSSSGEQRLLDLTGKVRAHATSGNLRIGMIALHEGIDLLTTSGDVELLLPTTAFYKLNFRSASGNASVAFPMDASVKEDHRLTATIGDGGPTVQIETSSGDLRILKD
ncbi:hypothetical protein CIG75_04340 [Tumebacillus algifaecis]|uniref:DUF4097 domain-containing protein n=1 Tax=Tumebacillus algifaecis TaxID=1214604 RepID=A0A223CY15_9BACL|nr:DUF4097 family beta strand repeat-containing protein [Tumebacillus algifaecis]ASS74289.1 hypothetical protein CIG75_04340 [Tumebacillus algifaecis]